MSSNNQGGGPWRSQGRGPWGQGPSGPQPTADLEEIIRRVQEALGKLTSSGGSRSGGSGKGGFTGRTGLFLILGAVLVWFAWGTFYSVQPNEVGINLVLGRYTGKTAAGLNTNWPWPIGTAITPGLTSGVICTERAIGPLGVLISITSIPAYR